MFIELTRQDKHNKREIFNTEFIRSIEGRAEGSWIDFMGKGIPITESYEHVQAKLGLGEAAAVFRKPEPVEAAASPLVTAVPPKKKRGRPSNQDKIKAEAARAFQEEQAAAMPSSDAEEYTTYVHTAGSGNEGLLADD